MELEGVVEKFPAELFFQLRTETYCSKKLWKRMNKKPFYEITLFDSYLSKSLTGYIEKEEFESTIKLRFGGINGTK
jgi:hypothetical protein